MSKAADFLHIMEAAKTGMLTIYNSKSDMYGNRYFAFEFEDFITDKKVVGKGPHDSNISSALSYLKDKDSIITSSKELPIREFNRMFKDAPRAGTSPEDIAKFITKNRE